MNVVEQLQINHSRQAATKANTLRNISYTHSTYRLVIGSSIGSNRCPVPSAQLEVVILTPFPVMNTFIRDKHDMRRPGFCSKPSLSLVIQYIMLHNQCAA